MAPAIFFLGRKSEKELRIESLSGQFTLSPVSCIQQLSTIDLPFFGFGAVKQDIPILKFKKLGFPIYLNFASSLIWRMFLSVCSFNFSIVFTVWRANGK